MAQQDPYWINLQSLLEFVSSLSTAENQLSQDCFCQCCRDKGVRLLFDLLCLVRESQRPSVTIFDNKYKNSSSACEAASPFTLQH